MKKAVLKKQIEEIMKGGKSGIIKIFMRDPTTGEVTLYGQYPEVNMPETTERIMKHREK